MFSLQIRLEVDIPLTDLNYIELLCRNTENSAHPTTGQSVPCANGRFEKQLWSVVEMPYHSDLVYRSDETDNIVRFDTWS